MTVHVDLMPGPSSRDAFMKVILVDADPVLRAHLGTKLGRFGCSVAPFSDARTAFLFLLGKLDEVSGVVVNTDTREQARWLIQRLELLPVPLSVVTYSGRDREQEAQIERSLLSDYVGNAQSREGAVPAESA